MHSCRPDSYAFAARIKSLLRLTCQDPPSNPTVKEGKAQQPDILQNAMSTAALIRALAQDVKIYLRRLSVVWNWLGDYFTLLPPVQTFIYDEWEDARAGLSCRTTMAVTLLLVRDDDVPLMQKYKTQPNGNLKLKTRT